MHKKTLFFAFIILLKINTTECAQKSSSHYQLQLHQISLERPAKNEFVEPIISCIIKPSLMEIKHGEVYFHQEVYFNPNVKYISSVISTVALKYRDYEKLTQYIRQKRTVYIEGHNNFRTYWVWFKIEPKQVKIEDKKKIN